MAADGRISDELVGEGAVHVVGEAASRMIRGQRVHVTARLSTSATLYPAAVATAVATTKQGALQHTQTQTQESQDKHNNQLC